MLTLSAKQPTLMSDTGVRTVKVALVTEVFPYADHAARLHAHLAEARAAQADWVILPELPLNPWSPATPVAREDDVDGPAGWRMQLLRGAAVEYGLTLLGGAILRDSSMGGRYNTALFIDPAGQVTATYEKLHLPQEEGFWETDHYLPGRHPPRVIDALNVQVGIQICSDANRPVGAQVLAAQGVEVILAPRATSAATYGRWLLAYRAMALTASAFVVSVNRPGPEAGVQIGGPSLVVDPEGEVVLQTTDAVAVVALDLRKAVQAKRGYPGYLDFPEHVYADAWQKQGK